MLKITQERRVTIFAIYPSLCPNYRRKKVGGEFVDRVAYRGQLSPSDMLENIHRIGRYSLTNFSFKVQRKPKTTVRINRS